MAEPGRTRMPRGVELAWRTERQTKPGPRPTLSLEQIVRAAIDVADQAGITAVSLARVATELGCATSALYRHVRSKDDLLVLMRDAAVLPPPAMPPPDPGRWRASLDRLGWEIYGRYRAHPWVLEVPSMGPSTTPNELMWGEHLLRAMSRTNLTHADRLRAVTLLTGYVREQARLVVTPPLPADNAAGEMDYVQLLRTVMTPHRYPMFCQILASDAFSGPVGYADDDFQFGLDCVLSGLADLDRRRAELLR
jgi:AcrR family transcriptional regulator